MIFLTIKIGPLLLIIGFIAVIVIPFIIQRMRLVKNKALLKAQDEKLKEMTSKQNESEDYKDFTDGHLYQ